MNIRFVLASLVALWGSDAWAQDTSAAEVDKLLGEAARTVGDLKGISTELAANIAEKREIEKEMAAVETTGRAVKDEVAQYQASGCGRTFTLPREQAAYNRCESWLRTLKPKVDGWRGEARTV